jgi:surface polysaccharide O-acyltransferase-like enzyme
LQHAKITTRHLDGLRIGQVTTTNARASAGSRDQVIDTMRGIAILMVIGIHSMPQPLDTGWAVAVDAALRPCVPIFLFASGYLTALSGRAPIGKRLKAALIPYLIAFAAAYAYMTLHNPTMDHRVTTTLARLGLAYVFVYYYVFVYIGCTAVMWLILLISRSGTAEPERRLALLLMLAIGAGLIAGSYLDPALSRLGFPDSVIEEVRMRDIPFWFSFMAAGALTAMFAGFIERSMRSFFLGGLLAAYLIYAAVRILGIGDAAAYDSIAFFGYAGLLCLWLLTVQPRFPWLAAIGSGSYFIYLWHIFVVMALRDHAALRQLGPVPDFAIAYGLTVLFSVGALLTVRQVASPRVLRWLGA